MEGCKWKKDGNGKWIDTNRLKKQHKPKEDITLTFKKLGYNIDVQFYDKTNSSDIVIHNIDKNKRQAKLKIRKGQSDSGANACATCYLELLEEVVWIKPLQVGTASNQNSEGGLITMQAVGKLPIRSNTGEIIRVACYYSSEVDGTLVSPQAIAMEHHDRFYGWIHYSNNDTETGYIRLCERQGHSPFSIALWSNNNLWYHEVGADQNEEIITAHTMEKENIKLKKLNSAAEYEL